MIRQIIKRIKSNKVLYKIYQEIFGLSISFIGLFLPVKNKIFFVSFNGEKYDDSPRVIYEAMMKTPGFKNYEFVWAFRDPTKYDIKRGKKIQFDSLKYYFEALTSKIWITNVSVERGLKFKKKKTIYVNTWHGTPIKRLDKPVRKNLFKHVDIFCVQCQYAKDIFQPLYGLNDDAILMCDYPRNDELLTYSLEKINGVKNKFGIPKNKKVILYMPTYRAYLNDEKSGLYMAPPINLSKWKEVLGDEYVVLFRLHYLVEKQLSIPQDGFSYSVTNYSKLNDLYAISDVLISDYSSAFFDYSILERPMLCFAYDKEEYIKKTGLLMSLEDLPCKICSREDELLFEIKNIDISNYCMMSRIFKQKYAPFAGLATDRLMHDLILKIRNLS